MTKQALRFTLASLLLTSWSAASPREIQPKPGADERPWRAAGLSDEQAASHLLDRFAFGAKPGDVERVSALGPLVWLERQIEGVADPEELTRALQSDPINAMSATEIAEAYPPPGQMLRQLQSEGKMTADHYAALQKARSGEEADSEMLREARQMLRSAGFKPRRRLDGLLAAQKVVRAVHSENQLHEVLVDFWFNHFNVSLSDNEARVYVLPYERDAIRPHVLGDFRDLLGATAKHPAMLLYLDNARSRAEEGQRTAMPQRRGARGAGGRRAGARTMSSGRSAPPQLAALRPTGLNENYARELLELHTLGVDGGYTQDDIVAVARAFTGWTVLPPASARRGRMPTSSQAQRLGFVVDDGFFFHPGFHDAESKTILGQRFRGGRGMEEGERVLDLLVAHPSTARFLSHKLAVRFVADEPPSSLVDSLAEVFQKTDGNLAAVLRALARSPAFWSPEALRSKIKSPLEVAASSLRALDAKVQRPDGIVSWIERMGQPLYRYEAPTGFPDRSETWVNSGALLVRMNFGLELARGEVNGVRLPQSLRQPPTADTPAEMLEAVALQLLPGRDASSVTEPLDGLLAEADLTKAVGLVLGSPEFQRR
ncbi:MAG: DUF1800 domain-containing protein [Acidobacteriota bacterium]